MAGAGSRHVGAGAAFLLAAGGGGGSHRAGVEAGSGGEDGAAVVVGSVAVVGAVLGEEGMGKGRQERDKGRNGVETAKKHGCLGTTQRERTSREKAHTEYARARSNAQQTGPLDACI